MYKYIHTCIYIHIHMSAHIHTNTYIHTRIQNVHMNARKARLKRRRRSDCARSPAAHLTITTVRRPDHIRLSALVRSQSAQFTQAPSLAARPWPPETSFRACIPMQKYIYRVIFIYISIYVHIYKNPPKWLKNDLISGGHSQAGSLGGL